MGNLQVRFLEGWAPAMAPGYSTNENHALAVQKFLLYSNLLASRWEAADHEAQSQE